MCDCFHLPFPNWHGSPGTGAGRRLKGPEPEDDSVCEDAPEFLEGERPRPQGSSPVNEYPATEKYTDLNKEGEEGSASKKGKKTGFGSFFEKRSKMSQDACSEPDVIVKTPKEVCAKGLVVSGGGKEGLFIKGVEAESPAAKHLSMQEGDQILSATVYFDDVSYEDALQILEHAQPYKMEFCLKRKPLTASDLESSSAEIEELAPGEEGVSQLERGRTKRQRRQDARISWPKFPSFTMGRKAHFKRSHSTSEAEEQRKLEMSPPTSDTESPMKSQTLGKDKKTKKQKITLSKLKMKGVKSKSVEEETDSSVPVSSSVENVQAEPVLDTHSPPPQGSPSGETAHFAEVSGPVAQTSQHRVDLISLDKTLKTTDITDLLADRGSSSTKKSPDKKKKKKERSELKVNIQGKEKEDLSPDSRKTPEMGGRAQDLSSKPVGPNLISLTEWKGYPIAVDINAERIDPIKSIPQADKGSSAEKIISTTAVMGDADICLPKVDMSFDMPDLGLRKKSDTIKSEKFKKDRSILIRDSERYGIRPRGPMADISMTKKYLGPGSLVDGDSNISKPKDLKMKIPTVKGQEITSNKKDASIKMETVVDVQSPQIEIQASRSQQETSIDETEKTGTKTVPKFKMPKIEVPDFKVHDSITMTEVKASKSKVDVKDPKVEQRTHKKELRSPSKQVDIKIELLKREDIEIPGMEASAGNFQTIGMKLPETGRTDEPVPVVEIHVKKGGKKVDGIKDTTSKTDLQTFKLPKVDTSFIDVHQQITKSDVTAEKVKLDLTADSFKPKTPEMAVKGQSMKIHKVPKIDSPDPDAHEPITMTQMHFSSSHSKMDKMEKSESKLPKREDIEIPGMESTLTAGNIQTKDIQSHGIDEQDASATSAEIRAKQIDRPTFKLPKIDSDFEVHERITKRDVNAGKSKSPKQHKKDQIPPADGKKGKFKTPPVPQYDVSFSNLKADMKLTKERETGESKFISDTEIKTADINADLKSPSTEKDRKVKVELGAVTTCQKESEKKSKKTKVSTPTVGISKPDIRFPDSGVKLSKDKDQAVKVDVKVHGIEIKEPTIEIEKKTVEAKLPGVEVEGPSVEGTIDIPEVDSKRIDIKLKKPKISLPKVGISKPDITLPKISGSLHLPSVDVSVTKPEADIHVPDISADVTSAAVKLPEADLTVSGKGPAVDIKDYSMEVGAPDVDIDRKAKGIEVDGQGSKFKLPKFGISLPKGKGFEMDITGSKQDVDISLPQVTAEAKLPGVEVKGSSEEGTVDLPEVDSKGIDIKLKKPKMSLPKFGISKPDITLPKISGSLHLPSVDVSVTKPEADISVPDISADVTSAAVKLPEADLTVSGKAPKVDIKDYSMDVGAPDVDIDMKAKGIEVDGHGSKFKMPHIKMPSFGFSRPEMTGPKISGDIHLQSVDISVTKPDAEIHVPDISADVTTTGLKFPEADLTVSGKVPAVDLKDYSMDVGAPDVDIDVKVKGTELEGHGGKFKLPKFGISLPKAKGFEMDISGSKPDVDISLPQVTAEAKLPGVEVEGPSVEGTVDLPEVDSKGIDIKLKKPKMSLPKFGISKPDITLPKISGSLHLPSVDVSVTKPEADISVPDISADVTSAAVKLPEADLTVSGKAPTVDLKDYSMDVGAPDVDIDMKAKGIEVDGHGSKFKMPHIKMPSFGFSRPEITGPKISGDVHLPSVDISIKKPDAEIHVTDISADVTTAGLKLPEADLAVSGKPPAVDLKDYSMEVAAPDVDIDMKVKGTELEGHGGKFKLPKFGISLPKAKGFEMDITGSKPDVDISLPQVTAEAKLPGVEVKGPSEEGTVDLPEVDSKGIDIKLKKPKMSLPKFGISKPDITLPKISGSLHLPSVDVSVTKPEADISVPDISADVTSAAVKLPEADLTVSGKAPTVDLKDYSMDVGAPDVDIDMKVKGIEVDGHGSKFKMPHMKMPSFGFSRPEITGPKISGDIHLPSVDISVKKPEADISVPDISADVTSAAVKLPEADLTVSGKAPTVDLKDYSMDVGAPDVDIDMKVKGIEVDGHGSKFKMPHMKMPSFGFSRPEITGPKISGDIHLPSVDISVKKPEADISVPDISADVTSAAVKLPEADLTVSGKPPAVDIKDYSMGVAAPDVDIDMKVKGIEVDGHGSKFKMPHMKMPSFGFSRPEITGPKISGDIHLPSVDISVKKPDAEIHVPDISADVTTVAVKLPEADLTLSGKAPAVDIKDYSMDVGAPDVDIDMKAKGIEVDRHGSKFKMPHMKMPSFGFSRPEITGPKISGDAHLPSVDISIKKPDAEIHVPDISADVTTAGLKLPEADLALSGKAPTVDLKDYSMEVGAHDLDIDMKAKGIEVDGQGSKFKLPKFGISLPKAKGFEMDITGSKPDVDISVPKVTVEAKLPGVEVEGPSVEGTVDLPEVDSKGIDIKLKKPKMSLPKFGISKPDITLPKISGSLHLPSVDVSVTKPEADISVPDISADVTSAAVKLPEADLTVSGKAPTVDIKDYSMDVGAPDVDIDMKVKGIEVDGHGSKFKMPHIKMPSFGFSRPEITGPKISGDVHLPSVDISVKKPDAEIHVPDISADVTTAGLKLPEADLTVSGKPPAVDIKDYSMDVAAPDVDIDVKVKGTELEGHGGKFKLPKFGISLPKAKGFEMDITGSKPDVDISLPTVTAEARLPGVDVEGPSMEGTVDLPEVDSKGIDIKLKKPKMSLPKFGFSKPDITLPKISGSLPSVDISVTKPDADINVPDISADFTSAAVTLPEADLTVSGKAPAVDIKDYSLDVGAPDVDIDMKVKGIEVDGHGSKFKMPHMKMPSFGFSRPEITGPKISGDIHLPSVDISVKKPDAEIHVPDISADVTTVAVKLPEADLTLLGKAPAVDIKDYSMDVGAPDVDIDMKAKGFEVDRHGSKFKMPHMKMPSFGFSRAEITGPKISGDAHLEVQAPESEVSLPEGSVVLKGPEVDIKSPETQIDIKAKDMDIITSPTKFKMPHIKMPSFGFSRPEITGPKISGDVHLPSVDISVTKPDTEIHVPDISADVTTAGGKLPDVDLTISGKAPAVDIKDYSMDVGAPDVDIDMKAKGIEVDGQGSKFKMPHIKMPSLGFSRPEITGPKISGDAHLEFQAPESEVSLPEGSVVLKGPEVDIKSPETQIDIKAKDMDIITSPTKFKMPHLKMPSFGFSRPEITGPKISGDVHLPSVDISVTKPDMEIHVPDISADVTTAGGKLPEADLAVSVKPPAVDLKDYSIDIQAPDVDIGVKGKGIELEGQGSRFKLPKFGITFQRAKGPAVDASVSKPDVDISVPQVKAEATLPDVQVEVPSVEGTVDVPEVDVKDFDVKLKKPKMSLPKFGFSKPDIKAPEIDVILPKQDISLAEGSLEIKGPKIDIKSGDTSTEIKDVDMDMDIVGSPTKFKMPTIKFPKFGISPPKFTTESPDIKADIKLPEIEASAKVDIGAPSVDIKMPDINVSQPKGKGYIKSPDIDINLPEVDMSLPEYNVDVKGSEIAIKTEDTEANIDAHIGDSPSKYKLPTFKMPKLGFTSSKVKTEIPGDVHFEVQPPDSEVSLPEGSVVLKGPVVDIKAPETQIDIKAKDMDIVTSPTKFKMPHIKMPSFGFSRPEITGPKITGDVHLPSMDISVTKPDMEIHVPDISADVTTAGVQLPEADLAVSVKPPAVDLKDYSIDIQAPDVDIGVEGKGIELEGQGSKFKLPKFGVSLPKTKGPAVDISVSKLKADISLPEVPVEAKLPGLEVEGPSLEGTVDIPEVDSKGVDAKLKRTKMSFPKFGFSKPEFQAPESEVSLPEGSVVLKGPEVDIKSPETQIDIKAKDMDIITSPTKFKMPHIKMPSLGFSRPEITGPKISGDAHLEVQAPDSEVSLPEGSVVLKGPEVDIKSPETQIPVDIKAKDIEIITSPTKFKMPHIKMPSFGFSRPEIAGPKISGDVHLPSVDISVTKPDAEIHVPDISADVTTAGLKLPEADLAVSGKPPAVDLKDYSIDIQPPDVDIGVKGKGIELEGQGARFKLPKFGITFQRAKGPAVDASVSKPGVDISLPQVTVEAKLPDVQVEGPSVEGIVDVPEVDSKDIDVKLKKPKMSLPKFGFSKPDIKAPEFDVSLPKQDISLAEGSVEIKGPKIDIKSGDTSTEIKDVDMDMDIVGSPTKFKMPTIKFPKFGISPPKFTTESPDIKADIKLPEIEASAKVDIGAPSVDIKMPDINVSQPKGKGYIKSPDIDINLPEVDMSLPEYNIDVKGSEIAVKTEDTEANIDAHIGDSPSKYKLPTFKMPKFGFTSSKVKTEIPGDVHLEVQAPESEVSLPEGSVVLKGPVVDIKSPETQIDIKAKDMDIVTSPTKFKMPHIKMPSFGFSKPEITGPKISGDVNLPSVDISVTKPDAEIHVPDISADVTTAGVKCPEADLTVSGKPPAVDLKDYSVDIQAPDVDIGVKAEDTVLEGQGSKFKLPKFGVSLPKTKGPAVDISVSKLNTDISLPEVSVKAKLPGLEVEGPSVEGTVDIPEVDSKGVDAKLKKTKMSFPKFGFSKPEVQAPESEVSLPEGSVVLKGPEVDIKSPETQIDINTKDIEIITSPTKFKMPTIKFPKFGISAPKVSVEPSDAKTGIIETEFGTSSGQIKVDVGATGFDMETVDLDKTKGDIFDVSLPKGDITLTDGSVEVKGPEVNIKAPDIPLELKDKDLDVIVSPSKFKLPSFKFPTFSASPPKSKVEAPEVSADITVPSQIKTPAMKTELNVGAPVLDAEVSLPEGSVVLKGPEVDIKAPETQIEIKAKDMDIITSPTKFKMPTIKFPKFGISAPKVSVETSTAKTGITETEFEPSSGQIKVDVGATSFDIGTADLDKTKGKTEMETQGIVSPAEPEGQGSRFKLPKFGISFQKAKGPGLDVSESKQEVEVLSPDVTVEAHLPSVELEGPSIEGVVPEVESKEVDLKLKKPKTSFSKFGFSKSDVKAPEIDVSLPKGDISLTGGSVEVKGPGVDIKAPDTPIELKDKDLDIIVSPSKFKLPSFKFPTFGASPPKSKVEAQKVSADITVPSQIKASTMTTELDVGAPVLDTDVLRIEIEKPDGKVPTLKFTSIDMPLAKGQGSDSKPEEEMSAVQPEGKTGAALEAKVDISDPEPPKPEADTEGSPSKFKFPTFKMPKFGFSSAKVKTKDTDVDTGLKSPEVPVEKATKVTQESIDGGTSNTTETDQKTGDGEGKPKSSKFSLSNVLKGFDVEFHVPALEEEEETPFSPREDVAHSREIKESTHTSAEKDSTIQPRTSHDIEEFVLAPTMAEEAEVKEQPLEEKEKEDANEKEENTDKGTFKFPKFGIVSPSKTIKLPGKGTSKQPTEGIDKNIEGDIEEEDDSWTSVRSSDAFADVSSMVTSEQPDTLVASPTKVKVKISEQTTMAGVREIKVPSDIITSTARTELILLEHHTPEKIETVTIPVSSEATLTSPDEKTQETDGEIHFVTSNIQAIPSSEHATVITKYEAHSVQALSRQTMTVKVGSASWTVEGSGERPGESSEGNILVEKHMVKSGDDKGDVIITQRVRQIVGTSSGEPILEDTASAMKKLRDTMHSEKMKFFEDADTVSSTVTVSTRKIEKHVFETSTEKK